MCEKSVAHPFLKNIKVPLILLIVFFSIVTTYSRGLAVAGDGICRDKSYVDAIHNLWEKTYPEFSRWAAGLGYKSDSVKRAHPYELYDIQLHTINLLRYSYHCKDLPIFEKLLDLYEKVFKTLQNTDQYQFCCFSSGSRRSCYKLERYHRMWLNRSGRENILCSSQFLYAVSEALVYISSFASADRSDRMNHFVTVVRQVLKDHYQRWCFARKGPFQVRGWGCKNKGRYVATGLNHFAFIRKKRRGKLGDNHSYCNAVTDTDMWIITGVANLASAAVLDPDLIRLSQTESTSFSSYLETGAALLQEGVVFTKLKDFSGRKVTGMVFDPGAWDDYPDHRYIKYSGKVFPDESYRKNIPPPVATSWDISHARRYVDAFTSLVRDMKILKIDFFNEELLHCIANQFAYRVFNGDFERPLFTNFWNGDNGWYRVGYNQQLGYGYGPGDLSIAALSGGYAVLAGYNDDLQRLYRRLYAMVTCGTEDEVGWLGQHFSGNRYKNRKAFRLPCFSSTSESFCRRLLELNFLSSLYRINRSLPCGPQSGERR